MKHLAAYLLLNLAGKDPKAKDIKALLNSVGIEGDDERIESLLSELNGKDINELIAEGSAKLASVPSGGGGGGGASAGAAGGGAGGGAAEAAPAEEAKKEEKEEESDEDMGFGLFD
ncbi:60S acidic ribosomal protein P2 [Gigaspora margarita]|uniref:60S acidic ribosomal protein P2 n=1 Tax=Gigaspora margarita TaxID=4874 RepID=A0A8H3XBC7_GIGMA|nr:60S acidic ribosomal protein P2 [Gigaspora margarita]